MTIDYKLGLQSIQLLQMTDSSWVFLIQRSLIQQLPLYQTIAFDPSSDRTKNLHGNLFSTKLSLYSALRKMLVHEAAIIPQHD